ncbi:MAG: aspartyl protease family protein [Thermoplasmata archaeon]|nr:aspartyl protease family protein [Thermoplasmata archaeon]
MRIPLIFDHWRTSVRLNATFQAQDRIASIQFLVDTGSSVTTLSYWDARLMGIDFTDLKRHTKPFLTYAGRVQPRRASNVGFLLFEEEGRLMFEQMKSVDVMMSSGNKQLDVSLPSVMGMDFLTECSYSLQVSPKEDVAFLEKIEEPHAL